MKKIVSLLSLLLLALPASAINPPEAVQHLQGSQSIVGSTTGLLDNVVNVRMYGAKGDGSTDDTAAIQAAINAAATGDAQTTPRGAMVYLPSGVYPITTLTLKRGVAMVGQTSDLTVLRHTSTTLIALSFDSTGLTPQTIQDRITIRNLSIQQVGVASAGAGISIKGVSSDAQAVIENVVVYNCYLGIYCYKTIHSLLRNVLVYYSIADGFQFGGTTYTQTLLDCQAANNGGYGYNLSQGNYSQFLGCSADNNVSAAFYLNNCLACNIVNCGNEQNQYGASLLNCNGCVVQNFYTTLGATTINAVKLDATSNTVLSQISSATVSSASATYMVASVNSGQYNRLRTGYVANAWPSGVSTGTFIQVEGDTSSTTRNPQTIQSSLTLHNLILDGATFPALDGQGSLANAPRIFAIYNVGNVFSGIGMDSGTVAPRIAGDSAGVVTDLGVYSQDGSYTWTSYLKLATNLLTLKSGVAVKLNLPTSAGASGTLYSNAGVVTVSP